MPPTAKIRPGSSCGRPAASMFLSEYGWPVSGSYACVTTPGYAADKPYAACCAYAACPYGSYAPPEAGAPETGGIWYVPYGWPDDGGLEAGGLDMGGGRAGCPYGSDCPYGTGCWPYGDGCPYCGC